MAALPVKNTFIQFESEKPCLRRANRSEPIPPSADEMREPQPGANAIVADDRSGSKRKFNATLPNKESGADDRCGSERKLNSAAPNKESEPQRGAEADALASIMAALPVRNTFIQFDLEPPCLNRLSTAPSVLIGSTLAAPSHDGATLVGMAPSHDGATHDGADPLHDGDTPNGAAPSHDGDALDSASDGTVSTQFNTKPANSGKRRKCGFTRRREKAAERKRAELC